MGVLPSRLVRPSEAEGFSPLPTKTTLNETIVPNANKKSSCYIATAVDKVCNRVGIFST